MLKNVHNIFTLLNIMISGSPYGHPLHVHKDTVIRLEIYGGIDGLYRIREILFLQKVKSA